MKQTSNLEDIRYFMAHAPAAPDWFTPDLPKPEQPPGRHAAAWGLTEDEQCVAHDFTFDHDRFAADYRAGKLSAGVEAFYEAHVAYWSACDKREVDIPKARDIQWPLCWAKLMVDQLEAHMQET